MVATIDSAAVRGIVTDIWSSILGLEIVEAGPSELVPPTVTGLVHISGDAEGSVSLECPGDLARTAAALMFGTEVDDLAPGEMEDAFGELANMTGGGVKSLLAGQNQLSLPTVIEGSGYHLNVPGAVPVLAVWFACGGTPVVVRVYERASVAAVAR